MRAAGSRWGHVEHPRIRRPARTSGNHRDSHRRLGGARPRRGAAAAALPGCAGHREDRLPGAPSGRPGGPHHRGGGPQHRPDSACRRTMAEHRGGAQRLRPGGGGPNRGRESLAGLRGTPRPLALERLDRLHRRRFHGARRLAGPSSSDRPLRCADDPGRPPGRRRSAGGGAGRLAGDDTSSATVTPTSTVPISACPATSIARQAVSTTQRSMRTCCSCTRCERPVAWW